MSRAHNSIKNWRNLPISNPKPDIHNINAYIVWWKSIEIYSNYCLETNMRMFPGRYLCQNLTKNCPLAIPNQISTISMHIPYLVKIHWHLLKWSKFKYGQTDVQTDRHQRETWIPRHTKKTDELVENGKERNSGGWGETSFPQRIARTAGPLICVAKTRHTITY